MEQGTIHHAVLFIDKGRVVKQMLYSEFEAVLDNVVGIGEFKDRTMQAVFVKINGQHKIVAAVFFLIDFDDSGAADPGWNIPLHQLSEAAGKGPDLGAGPIKLVCQSQCPAAWHQQSLWDPVMEKEGNTFVLIRDAVKDNKLSLPYEEPEAEMPVAAGPATAAAAGAVDMAAIRHQVAAEIKAETEGVLKQAKLRVASLQNKHKQEVAALHKEYLEEIRDAHEEARRLKEALAQSESRVVELQGRLDNQVQDIENLRHEYVSQGDASASDLKSLEEKFELELKAKVEAATREMEEALEMRQVELNYRDEQMQSLRDEVAALRQEKQRLLSDGAGNLLDKLEKSGITYVAYNPALGHVNIPLAEMGVFLDDPDAWFARQCDISPADYAAWQTHYEFPVCKADIGEGMMCGEPLERVDSPTRFLPGRSDRCAEHQGAEAAPEE